MPRRICNKRPYTTRAWALREIRIISEKAAYDCRRKENRVYWCKPCKAWHTTSKPATGRRGRKKW